MLKRGFLILRNYSKSAPRTSRFRYTLKAAFGKYLLLTNTVSSGALMIMGDIVVQEFHNDFKARENENRYDYPRLGIITFF